MNQIASPDSPPPIESTHVTTMKTPPNVLGSLQRDEYIRQVHGQQFSVMRTEQLKEASQARELIFDTLHQQGALLIRGDTSASRLEFEALQDALGFSTMPYTLGVSPRSSVSAKSSTSTEAPAFLPIGIHSEMAYTHVRPRYIAFFCDIEPSCYGETPVVDNVEVYKRLPQRLKDALHERQLCYRRYFLAGKKRFPFEQRIADIFATEQRDEVEALCLEHALEFEWQANGDLVTYQVIQPIVRHPQTGDLAVNLNLFHPAAQQLDYEQIRSRYSFVAWHAYNFLQHRVRNSPKATIKTLWGDRTSISDSTARELHQVFWQNTTLFPWRKGDVLLLDNIRYSHGRLNVKGPRRILAALANAYNMDDTQYQVTP